MNTKLYYPAVMQKDDNAYSVWIPDIEGCISQGDSIENAIEMICEAVGLFFEQYNDMGKELPQASDPATITLEKNQFIALIEFDKIKYQKKYCTKSVKKTLTIPMYLDELAKQNHINFSAVLKDALEKKLS